MLTVVIKILDYDSAQSEIIAANQDADIIEFRLDYLNDLKSNLIERLHALCEIPVIFTLRNQNQGGNYNKSEEQRLKDLLDLCRLSPDYLDLDYDTPIDIIEKISLEYPKIKLICSYHNFETTPSDLLGLFNSIIKPQFHIYKIATMANSCTDALRMIETINIINLEHPKYKFTGICMGEHGKNTRILGPIFGNAFTYTYISKNNASAPGQISITDLINIYNFKVINSKTKIFGLIGKPVKSSVGHILHNKAISILKQNAIYIKLEANQDELTKILEICRNLPFLGFSVTMPHKEEIIKLLDEINHQYKLIYAINTIYKIQNKFIGFNTDGIGAIRALTKKIELKNKTIVILGAGGAARAIAYEAIRCQAKVIIVNRSINKATILAQDFNCEYYELNQLKILKNSNYSVIINTLPESAYSDPNNKNIILADNIKANILAIDIVYQPIQTSFLKIAQQANCDLVFGYEMYIEQAIEQIKIWFEPKNESLIKIKQVMHDYFNLNLSA